MSQSDSSTEARTYSITEVGQISGLAPHTLRWYEELGLIEDVARGPGGRRVYSELHLGWLEFTASVRDTGMSVADMKRYVSLAREGDSTVHARLDLVVEVHLPVQVAQGRGGRDGLRLGPARRTGRQTGRRAALAPPPAPH